MFAARLFVSFGVTLACVPLPAYAQSSGWTCVQIHEKCIETVVQMGRTPAFAKSHCAGHLAQAMKGGIWPASTGERNRHPAIHCQR